ncbi:Asp-tRNA(Asn)/Glu-tRNA(Gln) amidotransferase subunit GatC [Candidatus Parcubacteria bacterium]|uniref:Asp-tRNA(Asn)/Glu-tRNA(Gln) amidotransferase GatCAB subunit C n=1 Tax=Candidatus Kaiserbacteria bacterium CG10_big_fil_rev_8_21_14_0_10_47_16 TaxID=1974608 RepID=A0A2H0UDD3_9BACT|nr:Asp-tRNA(Asn)/Glu-tRNA(Gln) amidotransferase subunit GatC [Candidatus Parcubacteria bacterium]PIR84401.1 MAG: Asp-tRNA(Asn)/Glu-tRNA(Gln) amidotransferase GatCAB subunit C [Candidatus Kaiserbacteria bacterium CG10_big_fil_rev_8_21_14_0_10_47_16]
MKREDIAHLATLARIKLTESEQDHLAENITDILGYVSAIGDITATEKPKEIGALYNVMREDVPNHEPGEYTERILAAAPVRKGQYVEVKKILGERK